MILALLGGTRPPLARGRGALGHPSRCLSPCRFLVVESHVPCPFYHKIEATPDSLWLSELFSMLFVYV